MNIPVSTDPLGVAENELPRGFLPAETFKFAHRINFDILSTPTNRVRVIARYGKHSNYGAIMSAYQAENVYTQRVILGERAGTAWAYFGVLPSGPSHNVFNLSSGTWHDITLEPGKLTVDGKESVIPAPEISHIPLAWFAGTAEDSNYYVALEWKLFEHWDGGVLVHRLLSATSPDSRPCLYDTIAHKAYFNS